MILYLVCACAALWCCRAAAEHSISLPVAEVVVPIKAHRLANLTDNDSATSWANDSNIETAWFELLLAEPAVVSRLEITPRTNRLYTLAVELDDVPVGQFQLSSNSTLAPQTIELPGSPPASRIRVASAGAAHIRVHEVTVLSSDEPPPPTDKNVLLLVVDDLNTYVGAFGGHPDARTPNIDALAARGVAFTNAHAPSPVCNASRTAMLSGVRPHVSGLTNNRNGIDFRDIPLLTNVQTLPQYFGEHGYETANYGRVFHRPDPESFDFVRSADWGAAGGPVFDKVAFMKFSASDQPLEETGDWINSENCGNFAAATHHKPFFAACGFSRPHLPWWAPAQFYNQWSLDEIDLPPGYFVDDLIDIDSPFAGPDSFRGTAMAKVQASGRWADVLRAYLATISFADAVVGNVLDKLAASPNASNTIVVLVSDHGFHLGEKDHFDKYTLWSRGTNIPLIIYDPALGTSGVSNHSVSSQDLYPTLIAATGLPPRTDLAGQSLQPLMEDPGAPFTGAALMTLNKNNHAIVSDQYRYIRYANGGEELYDNRVDPYEWHNLVDGGAPSGALNAMRAAMDAMLGGDDSPF